MNGYSIIFTAVFIVVLAGITSALSVNLIRRSASGSQNRPFHRRGRRA